MAWIKGGLVIPLNASILMRLSQHSSLPLYVYTIHTSYPHCQPNTLLFIFPYHHAIYHNSSLTHPTQKAWTLSFQPSQKVHQDGAVSAQMMDQMMGILSMPQKNLPHPLAPPDCTHLPYALFFPINSCGTTQVIASTAPSSDPSWGSGIVTMLQLNFISTNASQPQDSSYFNAINLYSHISHNAFELTQCIHPWDWDTIIVGRILIATGVEKEKWKMFWCWRWVRIERKKADYRFGTANDVVGIVEFDSECRQSARLKMVGVVGFIVALLGSS